MSFIERIKARNENPLRDDLSKLAGDGRLVLKIYPLEEEKFDLKIGNVEDILDFLNSSDYPVGTRVIVESRNRKDCYIEMCMRREGL